MSEPLPGLDTIVAAAPEASPRELAELLWMARKVGGPLVEPLVEPPAPVAPVQGRPAPVAPVQGPPAPPPSQRQAEVALAGHLNTPPAEAAPAPAQKKTRLRLDRRALSLRLAWQWALHRLAVQRRDGEPELDLPATVHRSAEAGLPVVVRRPAARASTHLVLLADRALAVEPWRDDLAALAGLARQSARFARVSHRVVDLSDADWVRLDDDAGAGGITADPGQPLLVLVLTDGLAPAVRSGALGAWLARLPGELRVAWLHPWGRPRWNRTPAGRFWPAVPATARRDGPLRVALVPLAPRSVAALEPFAAGRRPRAVEGRELPRELTPQPEPQAAEIDWPRRVAALSERLEPGALQVPGMLAAVPGAVDLPLAEALARGHPGMLGRVDVAQAITAGLLLREDRGVPALVFKHPGARRAALGLLARADVEPTLWRLLRHLRDPRGLPADRLSIDVEFLARLLDGGARPAGDPSPEMLDALSIIVDLGDLDVADWFAAVQR